MNLLQANKISGAPAEAIEEQNWGFLKLEPRRDNRRTQKLPLPRRSPTGSTTSGLCQCADFEFRI